MAERGENRDITDINEGAIRATPVRRSTRLNSASTPAAQTDGASTPSSKNKRTTPSSESTQVVRRSLRLSLSKSASPEDNLLKKVVTRRASTNAVSTPRRQSQDTKEGDHASASKPRSRRCVSESPTKKDPTPKTVIPDQTTESNVAQARRSTRLSTGTSFTPSKQLWSSKSRKNLTAVSEDPSESTGMIFGLPPLRKIGYEAAVSLTPPEKQHSNVDHIEDSPTRTDLKSEGLQDVHTHTYEPLQVNADNDKHSLDNFRYTKRPTEVLEELTSKEPQIDNIKEKECDTQSEGVALAKKPCNQKTLTSEDTTTNANTSPLKVAVGNSAEDNINMSAIKSHLIERSGDPCAVSSNLIPINTELNATVSNGRTETSDHKNWHAKSQQLSPEILPKVQKENNDMFEVSRTSVGDGNKQSFTEVCNGLNSCETYQNKQTDDCAPDDFHLEMEGCNNSDDDHTDIKVQYSTTLTSIHTELLNVSKPKVETNDIHYEHNSSAEYPQVTHDAKADDEKENESLCTNMDQISADGETSTNSFSHKTSFQNGNKITQRLPNSLTKCYSIESLTGKAFDKYITPGSTTPNKNDFVMHSTSSEDTVSVFESKDLNREMETVQNGECKQTVEDVTLNGLLNDDNQPASNDADNYTSEGRAHNMQQNQDNSNNDDEDDIFSEGSLSFDSDAIRTSIVNELTKTKKNQSQSRDENVITVGPTSQPSPLSVPNTHPELPDHESSNHIFARSPKIAKDNPGSNTVKGPCETDESPGLKHNITPKVKKGKREYDTLPSPAHNERDNLEISTRDSLQDIRPSIRSSLEMKLTSQEEMKLSTMEGNAGICKKRSKKKSIDATKIIFMECTKVGLPEDENSFSKKKRLTDFELPSINLSSKQKKTDDALTPDVSLKETVVAMMQLTDNPKPGRKIPEMSKEAQEKIDQHIAEYLSKQEHEKLKKQDDSTDSSMEQCDGSNEESNKSSQRMMEFFNNMADEGEESSVSDDSNAIPDDGESVGFSSNDNSLDESYERNSFIDDEEYELISGSECASDSNQQTKLEACEEVKAVPSSSNKRWARIVTIDSSSEEDDNVAVSTNENSLKVQPSSSSEEERSAAKVKHRSLYKTHLNQINHRVEQQVLDVSPVAISTKSTNTSIAVQENVVHTPPQIDQSTRQGVLEAETSPVFTSSKPRKTSITIQENISVKDIKDESLRETISDVVEMFCKRSMPQGEITLNVSLNYTPSSPGITHSSENMNGGTTTASRDKISSQEMSSSSNKRRRRKRKLKSKNQKIRDRCQKKNSKSVFPDLDEDVSDKLLQRPVDRKEKEILKKQLDTDSKLCVHSPGQNYGKEYCKKNVKLRNEPIAEWLPLGNQKQREGHQNKKRTSVDNLESMSSEENLKETDKFDHFKSKDKEMNSRAMFASNENYVTEPKRKRRKISASTSSNNPTWTMEIANMKPSESSNQQINHSSSDLGQTAFHPKDFRSKMLYNGKRVQRVQMSKILKRK